MTERACSFADPLRMLRFYTEISIFILCESGTLYVFNRPRKESATPSGIFGPNHVDHTCQVIDGELKYNNGKDSEVGNFWVCLLYCLFVFIRVDIYAY